MAGTDYDASNTAASNSDMGNSDGGASNTMTADGLASDALAVEELADQVANKVAEKTSQSLQSMTPREAVDKYFEHRDFDRTSTVGTQESSLYNHFVVWCEEIREVDEMRSLQGSDLADYRVWRRDKASERVEKLSPKSDETQQKITRTFIKHCETFDAVRSGLHEYVLIPNLDKDDEVREEIIDSESAKAILSWLRKYQYGDVQHIVWLLLSACGARIGGIHSLDTADFGRGDEGPYLKFRHRPETGTSLKNGKQGERRVSIKASTADVLDDYLEDNRNEITDEFGREPLLTTRHGRLAKSTIRNYIYAWTRPCAIGKECPYQKNPQECEAAQRNNWAFKCPDSLSSHPVRKGYITRELSAGTPKHILSDRCDVTEKVMDKHYDHRTEEEKMAARKTALELAHQSEPGYGE